MYHHFSDEERGTLLDAIRAACLKGVRVTISALASALGRSRKAIRNEVARGRDADTPPDDLIHGYNPVTAGRHARAAASLCVRKGKRSDGLLDLIRRGVTEDHHSPDQLVHRRLKEAGHDVSVSTIYLWMRPGGPLADCRGRLRFKGRRRKNGDLRLSGKFADARPLEQRPAGCTDRTGFGHIEVDTVVSARKNGGSACLFTFVDRKTRHVLAYKAEACTAYCFDRALDWLRGSTPPGPSGASRPTGAASSPTGSGWRRCAATGSTSASRTIHGRREPTRTRTASSGNSSRRGRTSPRSARGR